MVFVIADKSTSTKEVIVSRMQAKSSSLRVPVTVSFVTLIGRRPASKILSASVPGVSTWMVNVLSLFTNSFYNDVRFLNQATNSYDTRVMYVSDRNADMWRRDPQTGDVMGYTGCSLALVEV